MNFFKRKKKYTHERKSYSVPLSSSNGSFLSLGVAGVSNPASSLRLYEQSSAVSIPINKIVTPFKGIQPYYWDGKEYTLDHPVIELLGNPSPYFSPSLFMETLARDYLITGETYIISFGNINRPPLELLTISPRNISVVEGSNGFVNNFIVSGNTAAGDYNKFISRKSIRYLDGNLRELCQIRNYSTRSNSLLRGQSLLVPASREALQNIKGNEHNLSIIENGGRVSLVFHFEEDLSNDDYDAVCDTINNNYAGPGNAGKISVTTGGKLAINELGINNKDMDFAALQEASKKAIAMQYGVPLPLVTTEASTFNNYETAVMALFDDAVLPLADVLFEGLSKALLPRFGEDNPVAKITYKPANISALRARTFEEIKLRREMNLETVNELRSEMGRESVAGGDDVYQASTLIPVGTDLLTDDNLDKPRL